MKKFCEQILAAFVFTMAIFAYAPMAFAAQAQPVPIPEDPSIAPQINISGVGIGTFGYEKSAEITSGKGNTNFTDSALQIGAAQRLYEGGGVGSMAFGWLTTDDTNKGIGNPYFLHQAFVDFQDEKFEVLVGRSDNLTAHLVDFPTLRGDDLVTLTNPLNPFSNGNIVEEHRYANVASFTLNQKLKYFENLHAQHLINSADPSGDSGLNSFGGTFQYLGEPGLESFEPFPSWGVGFERINVNSQTAKGLNQLYAGGIISLNKSVVNRVELGFQDIYSWGSDLRSFRSSTDTFEADSNAAAASLRFLHSPFGRPAYQIAITGGYKNYANVADANSSGLALTGVRRLGHGFDAVAQYLSQWRTSGLSNAQSQGIGCEQRVEIGFAFNFDATFNEHVVARRSLLNQRHHYISE